MDFEDFVKKYQSNPRYFRQPEGTQYKDKKPIVLYGCSFTYGENIDRLDTFSYQLSEYLKRPVYNFASPGHSAQHMLFIHLFLLIYIV